MSSLRDIKVLNRRRAGWTYQEIGREFGLCRERVRQILNCLVGDDEVSRLCQNRKSLERKICYERLQALAENCIVCGRKYTRKSWLYTEKAGRRAVFICSPRCGRLYRIALWYVSPGHRVNLKRSLARWTLKNPGKVDASRIRWAERQLGLQVTHKANPKLEANTRKNKPWKFQRPRRDGKAWRAYQEILSLREQIQLTIGPT